jgi:hypothetical protein
MGFLTVVVDREYGLLGGYLLLDLTGRPLEFHCTAPVRPNRAQQILYGPTLEPYLFGEQIGQTLLASADIEPLVVCTDQEPALAVRDYVSVPVVLVLPAGGSATEEAETASQPQPQADLEGAGSSGKTWRLDGAHSPPRRLTTFNVGPNRLAVPESRPDECRLVTDRLGELSPAFDLAEPFQRIREAIAEARRGGH